MTTYYIEDWDKWSSNPSYGGLNNRKASWAQQPVLLPNYLGFSDYSGSDVERSNVRVWKDQFSDSEGEVWVESYGGHGTTQIVVHPDRITKEMEEFIAALEDYPVADENDLSQMDMELQDEAWESWARSDFRRALRSLASSVAEQAGFDTETVEDALYEVSDDDLLELFSEGADKANQYWECETGGNMWINLDRVVGGVDEDKLLAAMKGTGELKPAVQSNSRRRGSRRSR